MKVRPLLEINSLTVELATPAGWIRPVNKVSLEINAGESLGLVGESGSGKTMLSLALMGLLPQGPRVSGEINFGGNRLERLTEHQWQSVRGHEIAMIFQEPMTSLNPVMRVGAQIEEAIRVHEPRLSSADVRDRMLDALHKAAVPEPEERARQYPHQLSRGAAPARDDRNGSCLRPETAHCR
jgi:ABC-type microcin C transport system duplicated ATPase subunit YejF